MPPLNVLHLTAPGPVGGLESVVQSLALGHAARGNRVAVFASMADDEPDHPFTGPLRAGGVQVFAPRMPSRGYWRERSAMRQIISKFGPAIVHSHGYRSDVVGLAATAGLPVRRVTTVHGFTGGDWKNRLYERVQLRAFRRFDAVVTVSRPIRERVVASGVPDSRVHLIANSFAPRRACLDRAHARGELGLPQDRFLVGWVGRVSREKALDVALDALESVNDLPVTLVVIGDGRERATLETRFAESGMAGRVIWLGVVPECSRYFPAFDLYVISSHTEGTPITVLEAMHAGVPVVATAVGGIPDVLTAAEGWLAPPGKPFLLAAAIREAWDHPDDRERKAAAASRRLAEHFAVEPWLDHYETLYQSLLTTGSTD